MAGSKREFLALPVMGAGMTAMWVTPGLGTQVHDSTGAGKQTGRLAEGFPRNRLPRSMARPARPAGSKGRKGWVFLACVSVVTARRWANTRRPRPTSPSPTPWPTPLLDPATEVSFQGNRGL